MFITLGQVYSCFIAYVPHLPTYYQNRPQRHTHTAVLYTMNPSLSLSEYRKDAVKLTNADQTRNIFEEYEVRRIGAHK